MVSISALSDRIAQLDKDLVNDERLGCFNIRSFGSNCSAWLRTVCSARWSVVSISALSDRIAQRPIWY